MCLEPEVAAGPLLDKSSERESSLFELDPDISGRIDGVAPKISKNCPFLTRAFTRRHTMLRLSARDTTEKERNMAAKVETLRTTRNTRREGRRILARFVTAFLAWMRNGQLGSSASSEMRRYTGAR
jgi:hypothetical protein